MTRTAEKIRRLGHYAQMLQSHATAYFYLVVPEMMFGMDAAPEQRNLLGLIEADPALMRRVIMLRKWGQEVIKTVFGRRMHGISSVPGGVDKNLSRAECDRLIDIDPGSCGVRVRSGPMADGQGPMTPSNSPPEWIHLSGPRRPRPLLMR